MVLNIAGKKIGKGHPTFIIAELSANHNGSLKVALESVKAAKKAGADAIKLQTYTPDTITLDCDNDFFRIKEGTIWDGQTLHSLYKTAYTPWEWHEAIFREAEKEGLICFSSPFDFTAVDFLEELHVPAYKIASFEITDVNLIRYTASKGKPMIISTGIAEINDINLALEACKEVGNNQVILLKCTSAYPAPIDMANLNTIPDMVERFGVSVGLSDHTEGFTVPVVATSLGAVLVEKHFILDRSVGGPDASFSLDFEQFMQMVEQIRLAEQSLGAVSYDLTSKSRKNRRFSRSLFVAEDIKKGEVLDDKNIKSVRPADGLHPKYLDELLGQRVNRNLKKGTPMSWDFIDRQ